METHNRQPANQHAPSRRRVLVDLARGAVGLLATGAVDACSPAAATNDGADDVLINRLVAASSRPRIARRATPYRVTRPIALSAGTVLTLEAGTRIVWAGPAPTDAPVGVFQAAGDNTGVQADGGDAFVECETPSPRVYAAAMIGRRGFAVIGIQARECGHVHVDTTASNYAAVRTRGPDANVARDVLVRGGGARFAALQTEGQGACLLHYVVGARVEGAHYENVPNGIEWWGGDSGLEPWQNGAAANERKCVDVSIDRVTVVGATGGGIWGSMGQRITVRDCRVEECRDLCFDAEGCRDTLFERCRARNGRNGCFATFALCDGVRFADCRASVDDHRFPLFRTYNVSQDPAANRAITVTGGQWECLDPAAPGTIDSAMGPARDLNITGARLRNVRIDTFFNNMHMVRIVNNTLDFPFPLPAVAAIRAGASRQVRTSVGIEPGAAVVEGNTITYAASGPARATAIEVREDDFNSAPASRVTGNTISGPFATGVMVTNATGNAGIVPSFTIAGNRFSGLAPGAQLLRVTAQGRAPRPVVHWDDAQTRDGRAVPLAAALGG